MREICMSGLTSGDWKRRHDPNQQGTGRRRKPPETAYPRDLPPPRQSSTLLRQPFDKPKLLVSNSTRTGERRLGISLFVRAGDCRSRQDTSACLPGIQDRGSNALPGLETQPHKSDPQ